MIDPLPLIFLSIALVPGTADSVPSTEGMTFKVGIDPDIVASFGYAYSGSSRIHFKPGVYNQTVTISLPVGLPFREKFGGHHNLEPECFITFRELRGAARDDYITEARSCAILHYSYEVTDCHTLASVTVNNSVPIYFSMLELARSGYAASDNSQPGLPAPRSALHARWLGTFETSPPPEPDPDRIVSAPVPDGCGHVLAWPPFDPPRRQVHTGGVLAGSVACNDGLSLHLREGAGGDEPLCVRPGTADELVRRGVLDGDLPDPRGHRVRP